MALAPSRANVLISGIADWKIKLVADGLYRTLSNLRTGKVEVKPLETKDSQGRAIQFGYDLAASGQFLAVGTAAHFADLLGTIGTAACSHKISLINGQYVNSGATSMSPTTFGVKWKMISDKDMDDSLYCEFSASRRLTLAEYLLLLASSSSNPADGSNNADALATLLPVHADIVPAGIVQVELGATGGSLTDVVSSVRNGKFSAELLTTKDSRGQDIGYAVKVDYSVEGLETASAELIVWEAICARENQCKLTFAGGSTFTNTATFGITLGVSIDKDSDDVSFLKITGSGIILPAAFTTAWA